MHIKELSEALWQDVVSVCEHLLPDGKKESGEWVCGSVSGEKGKSLKVNISGKRKWSDFATGDGGDLIDLWMLARDVDVGDAVKEAKDFLGIKDDDAGIRQKKKTFQKPDKKNYVKGERYLEHLKERGLTEDTIKKFKCCDWSLWDGEKQVAGVAFPYIRNGEPMFIKSIGFERPSGKKVINASKNSEPCLFGWHVMNPKSKILILTEGEIDCMSMHEMGFDCALSVPFGGGDGNKQQWIDYEYHNLDRFEDIFICMDSDEAGDKAAKEISERLGIERCFKVKLPKKDANECLTSGVTSEQILACFEKAETFDPEELKNSYDFMESVWNLQTAPEQFIFETGIPELNDIIRPREAELTIINAQNGHGKSQFANQMLLDAIGHNVDTFAASLEFKPEVLLRRMYNQIMCNTTWSREEFEASAKLLDERLWMYNVTGTAKTDKLLKTMSYACKRYGVKVFLIDSLMKCGLGEDDYNGQKDFVDRLTDFKNTHSCHVFLITHSKKIEDESRPTGKMDVKGTGAITDLADNVWSIWRNKLRETGQQKMQTGEPLSEKEEKALNMPSAILTVCKQRNGDGREGVVGLEFDGKAMQFYSTSKGCAFNYLYGQPNAQVMQDHQQKYGMV